MIDAYVTLFSFLKYIFLVMGGYILSIIIKHILDKYVTKFRIDNYILYLLMVKTPSVSTKVIFRFRKRPDISEIKSKIEKEFDLEQNELPRNNSFLFKIREHVTPMKIMIIEPDKEKLFTITLETFGEDKLPKIMKSSFSKTINYFERITKKLSSLDLKSINVSISISHHFETEDKATYFYDKNTSISPKVISCNSKNFTNIEPMVNECLRIWRNKFL